MNHSFSISLNNLLTHNSILEVLMNRLQTILQATLLSLVVVAFTFAQDFSRSNIFNHERAPYQVDATVLQWDDGVNFDAIGLTSGGTFEVSARFPASLVGGLAGMNLEQVEIYLNDLPSPLTIKIYGQGTPSLPGALLYSEDVTSSAVGLSWNTFTLASPVTLTGADIWVGYEVTHGGGLFPAGVDDGPAVTDGDWIYFSGAWDHLNNFGLPYNWNIHAYVNDGGGGDPIVFADNFDAYTAGQQLACQNPVDWTTWSEDPCNATEDALVSNAHSFSSPNSVVIVQNNDQIKTHGDLTSGKWEINFMVYIPTGAAGYFNTLSGFTGGAYEWAMECYFNAGGAGSINAGGTGTGTFTWVPDQWKMVQVIADLDNDMGEFWYDGNLVQTWMWTAGATGSGAALQLAANDFFGATATDQMYIDDYQLIDALVPVELTSFTATSNNNEVVLNWSTATETNNQVFEVERKSEGSEFRTIGYVDGKGTTTEQQNYSYSDKNVEVGNYTYRLKQIDFNGQFEYSNEVEVEVSAPSVFALDQNYPNPFNPSTVINYSIPEVGFVKLAVFNLLGEKVAELVNQVVEAGSHQVTFNASSLPSGAYFYSIESGDFTQVKKMLLTK